MITNRVIGGNGGETASIFVTGLSETDNVTATKDGKSYSGKWMRKEFHPTTTYRYIKWFITEQKSANSSGCQASELGFYDKDGNRFNFPTGTLSTQSCAETTNETAEKLIDNNSATKFNYGGNNSKYPNISVQFDLGAGNEINLDVYSKYYWYTANDAEGRDPISWTLYGSNDGNTWDIIDEQLNQTITSSRLSKAGEWTIDTSVKTYYGWLIEGLRNYGTYTITATDGTNTATQDVLVDMATQYDIQMSYQTDWLLTSDDFQNGAFKNGTHSILTNQVDGTDGLRFVGAASNSNNSTYGGYYQLSGYIRLDLTIDFTNFSKLKFKGKKVTNHGIIRAVISDGLNNLSKSYIDADPQSNKTYPSNYCAPTTVVYGKSVYMPYSDTTAGTWYDCEIDLSEITGEHILSFIGGYTDPSGNPSSETHYCDIWLMK